VTEFLVRELQKFMDIITGTEMPAWASAVSEGRWNTSKMETHTTDQPHFGWLEKLHNWIQWAESCFAHHRRPKVTGNLQCNLT